MDGGHLLPLVLAGVLEGKLDDPLGAGDVIGLIEMPVSSALVLIFLPVELLVDASISSAVSGLPFSNSTPT